MTVNYEVIAEPGRAPIKAWVKGVELEDSARQQLRNVAALPFIHKHVAVMPDVHWGMGATVGSVIPTHRAIVPAAVGVDLGCGMIAQRTTLSANHLPDSLTALRQAIEDAVPVGGPGVKGSWREARFGGPRAETVADFADTFLGPLTAILEKHPKIHGRQPAEAVAVDQFGTLGTGNHFIEVCLDEGGAVWLMLHSGSRGVGNRIASYFIERAKEEMARWFIALPDPDLAYLPEGSPLFDDYTRAIAWAQDYAMENRRQMLAAVVAAMGLALDWPEVLATEDTAVSCHHNYVARENHFGQNVWVTRKGAVRAREGDLGIIPGSMGARSYIVRGKGNADSFHSCSHGAGRRMSRGQAKRTITLDDHLKATAGVECRKDAEVLDESPAAYKDIDAVIAAQADLIEVVHTLTRTSRLVTAMLGICRACEDEQVVPSWGNVGTLTGTLTGREREAANDSRILHEHRLAREKNLTSMLKKLSTTVLRAAANSRGLSAKLARVKTTRDLKIKDCDRLKEVVVSSGLMTRETMLAMLKNGTRDT